jgi:hypothetical protein
MRLPFLHDESGDEHNAGELLQAFQKPFEGELTIGVSGKKAW